MDTKTWAILIAAVILALCAGLFAGNLMVTASDNNAQSIDNGSAVMDSGLIVGVSGNVTSLTMAKGTVFTIRLDENPTTGYSWNASTTPGLTVLNSTYVGSGSGLMGAGGVHEWKIEASGTGAQWFNATYERPWEKFGNETKYQLIVNVA
jgi:inhibitor of cysteine peptidase